MKQQTRLLAVETSVGPGPGTSAGILSLNLPSDLQCVSPAVLLLLFCGIESTFTIFNLFFTYHSLLFGSKYPLISFSHKIYCITQKYVFKSSRQQLEYRVFIQVHFSSLCLQNTAFLVFLERPQTRTTQLSHS